MRRTAPSGFRSGHVVAGAWPPSPPAARVSIRVTCSENALVAALNQLKSTLAADTPVSFWDLQNAHSTRHAPLCPAAPQNTKSDTRPDAGVWR